MAEEPEAPFQLHDQGAASRLQAVQILVQAGRTLDEAKAQADALLRWAFYTPFDPGGPS